MLFVDLDLVDVLHRAGVEQFGVGGLSGAAREVPQGCEVDRLHFDGVRPPVRVRPPALRKRRRMRTAIGVDLGGSHVTAGVVTDDGTIHGQFEQDLDDLNFDKVIDVLDERIGAAIKAAGSDVAGIGIGSPGNIDARSGAVLYSPNFGWTNVPLGETLRKKFSLPVYVGNDARCATLGEFAFGAGKNTKNFVLLTLGTGIGGGIVADGDLILGNKWGAGEVGHHQIRPTDGFICACGKIGCFEAQASGTGLIRQALAVAPSFPRSTLLDVARDKLSSKKIRKAAQAGDRHALAAWNNYLPRPLDRPREHHCVRQPGDDLARRRRRIGRRLHARRRSSAGRRADDDGPEGHDADRDRAARQRCRTSRRGTMAFRGGLGARAGT